MVELQPDNNRTHGLQKMKWLIDLNRHAANDIEDLAYPPSGGRWKLVILGLVLPAVILHFGVKAWTTEEAIWFGHRGYNLVVHGQAAKALGVTYTSIGLFCHSRWFWGLLPNFRVYEVGTVISLIGFLGGLLFGVYFVFA